MAKYVYDIEKECFKREDNRGISLYVNISEANRIINLLNLGYSTYAITDKVQLINPKGTKSTVSSFIKNYKENNIEIPTDAPTPKLIFDEMTEDSRIDDLERRVKSLEERMLEKPNWRERLGL